MRKLNHGLFRGLTDGHIMLPTVYAARCHTDIAVVSLGRTMSTRMSRKRDHYHLTAISAESFTRLRDYLLHHRSIVTPQMSDARWR